MRYSADDRRPAPTPSIFNIILRRKPCNVNYPLLKFTPTPMTADVIH
jgi:hypothetical protein